ncbi:MAG: alpha/beta hydrolase [Allosphingosinicella sp.]
MARALAGLRRYQEAPRPPAGEPMPALAATAGATLRDYGGDGPPIVFIPSLINPPNILDLEGRSLLRWLSGKGRQVLLLDWGWPDAVRRKLSVAAHVEQILLPLLESLGGPADLAGYCLGGTKAAAAAQHPPARSLTLIAAPWRFDGFSAEARAGLARLWAESRAAVTTLGLLPMEVLQSAFWNLDPERTVAKFEAFADQEGEEARIFVALEDWANDGPPMSGAAARELFEDFFAADLPGRGGWQVGGVPIRPESLGLPVLNIVSTSDRIVPAATAMSAGERLELAQGHVGMIVGSRGRQALWEPLAAWLSRTAAR